MAKQKVEVEESTDQIENLLNSKEFKGMHLGSRSGDEIIQQDIITTGSFFWDVTLGGGFRNGSWARFYGDVECGKTSQGLRWAANWQRKYEDDGFVVIFNAEGRITKDLLDRSGINKSKDKFRVIDSNNADFVYSFTEKLISENPDERRYFIIIDSTDACERNKDKEKQLGEAEKIAGGATIASAAGKRLSLYFNRNNHFLYMTSQLRDKMATGPAAMAGGGKSPSGGNAPRYYSSLVGYIKKPWTDTFIYDDPSAEKPSRIGVLCNILLEKTPNEKTGQTVTVPIKYGITGGVYNAYEAMMVLKDVAGKYIRPSKTGAFQIDPEFAQELSENKIPFEENPRTEKKLREMFDNNPLLVDYVLTKYRKLFIPNT